MTGDFFEKWFRDNLLVSLKKDSVITMDNASFHRKSRLIRIIEDDNFKHKNLKLEFLPPYSPDLNPIEKTWANLKRLLPDFTLSFDNLKAAICYSLSRF